MWPQSQSPIFKLPIELRLRIYSYALGDADEYTQIAFIGGYNFTYFREPEKDMFTPLQRRRPANRRLTALIKTCKKIHDEAVEVLYTHNKFTLIVDASRNDLKLKKFLSELNPTSLARIRHLSLLVVFRQNYVRWYAKNNEPKKMKTWEENCEAARQLTGLQHLTVTVYGIEHNESTTHSLWALQFLCPLKSLRATNFAVKTRTQFPGHVQEQLCNEGEVLPFSLVVDQSLKNTGRYVLNNTEWGRHDWTTDNAKYINTPYYGPPKGLDYRGDPYW
ncbi:unnamed protein product [Periconia digitata]|uniref:DUF7730 domain-containing protein n=1 Tax=Periconia digitata TaxID=1303443 RepID=A0A9W4UIQ3_9PLEO|nr:unnamed protein product [Periconia digitata]